MNIRSSAWVVLHTCYHSKNTYTLFWCKWILWVWMLILQCGKLYYNVLVCMQQVVMDYLQYEYQANYTVLDTDTMTFSWNSFYFNKSMVEWQVIVIYNKANITNHGSQCFEVLHECNFRRQCALLCVPLLMMSLRSSLPKTQSMNFMT